MTDPARGKVASVGLGTGRMTNVTATVRANPRWNGHCGASSQRRAVTSDTAAFGFRFPGHVLRMIEFHVETFVEAIRKGLARRIVAVDVLMTNRTHRNVRRGELRQMTTGAVFMPGKVGSH